MKKVEKSSGQPDLTNSTSNWVSETRMIWWYLIRVAFTVVLTTTLLAKITLYALEKTKFYQFLKRGFSCILHNQLASIKAGPNLLFINFKR